MNEDTTHTPPTAPDKAIAEMEALILRIIGAAQEWPRYHVGLCPFCFQLQMAGRSLSENHFPDCEILQGERLLRGES